VLEFEFEFEFELATLACALLIGEVACMALECPVGGVPLGFDCNQESKRCNSTSFAANSLSFIDIAAA